MSLEKDLTRIADALEKIAAHYTNAPHSTVTVTTPPPVVAPQEDTEVVTKKNGKKKEEPKAEAPAAPKAEEPKAEAPAITLEQIRAAATKLISAGKGSEVAGLIQKHGGNKLSELSASVYPAFYADITAVKA